ncbi:MAG TPA: CPBP family intramembrane metalloprotease [Chloroflexaceae bacterium]|nr:CPBP family intramembrane metalloprotease [Chloroflexaceae bacterium]
MHNGTPTLDRRGVISFVLLAYGLAWLVASPLWLSGQGLRHPLALPLITAMMFTPALATLIVTRFISRPPEGLRAATGLRLGKGRGWGWYWLFAWLGISLLALATPFVGALFGLYTLDLEEFSGFRATLEAAGAGAALEQTPVRLILLAQLATLPLAPLLNAVPTFGEEWGWRGYLLPRLLPLGQWPALLISGVIWGLWHAPVILLGYNYPDRPATGWLFMVGMCVVWGTLLGWTRLATGSVWPAVIGHGAINGAGGIVGALFREGTTFDPALVGVTGVTGWLLPLLVIGLLVATGRLPVRDAPDLAEPAPPVGRPADARPA